MKKFGFIFFLATILFTSCSTSNKFASSFNKRKYTKGYFVDIPSMINRVIVSKRVNVPKPSISNTPLSLIQVTTPLRSSPLIKAPFQELEKQVSSKPILTKAETHLLPTDTTRHSTSNYNSKSEDYNYTAAIGCAVAVAGVVMIVINTFFTILAIVFLVLGNGLCVYSFFSDKIYLTWLGIIGLSISIILFTLIFL